MDLRCDSCGKKNNAMTHMDVRGTITCQSCMIAELTRGGEEENEGNIMEHISTCEGGCFDCEDVLERLLELEETFVRSRGRQIDEQLFMDLKLHAAECRLEVCLVPLCDVIRTLASTKHYLKKYRDEWRSQFKPYGTSLLMR
jgi:hypothetical protein